MSADWQYIMDLTRDMLAGARAAEWERVCRLQEERFDLIRQFFAAEPLPEVLDALRPQVSALLDMDAEVADLGRRAREEMAEGLRQLRQGKAARRAYGV